MPDMPDQTHQLVTRIASQYIADPEERWLAVEDMSSFLATFGAFIDFQGINSPSGFRCLGNFFVLWKDNRVKFAKRAMALGGKTNEAILKLDEELDAMVTCGECNEEKPKVETRTTRKQTVCFSCCPLFAVK